MPEHCGGTRRVIRQEFFDDGSPSRTIIDEPCDGCDDCSVAVVLRMQVREDGGFVNDAIVDVIDDLDLDAHEVVEIVPIYRGQTRYAVMHFVGDDDDVGSEIDTFETEDEAKRFAASRQVNAD